VDFLTLDNLARKLNKQKEPGNHTVFARVDTNTTLIEGTFGANDRIRCAGVTIKRLVDMGLKVVIGTHNGRRGDPDFVSLAPLREMLSVIVGPIEYIGNTYDDDGINQEAIQRINILGPREAFLLENLRFLPHETEKRTPEDHSRSRFIQQLVNDCHVEYYVNDAFSTCHRNHRSIVGFGEIPNFAGLTTEAELKSANSVFAQFSAKQSNRQNIFVLGGVKIQDYFELMENSLAEKKVDKILCAGAFGNLCLFARGNELGEASKKFLVTHKLWDLRPRLRDLMKQYPNVFEVPVDIATIQNEQRREYAMDSIPQEVQQKYQALDIGERTAEKFSNIIDNAKLVFVKGPIGAFDKSGLLAKGCFLILRKIADRDFSARCFTVLAGGDTSVMLAALEVDRTAINHVSLAGGALLKLYAGEELPGLIQLEKSYQKFGNSFLR